MALKIDETKCILCGTAAVGKVSISMTEDHVSCAVTISDYDHSSTVGMYNDWVEFDTKKNNKAKIKAEIKEMRNFFDSISQVLDKALSDVNEMEVPNNDE